MSQKSLETSSIQGPMFTKKSLQRFSLGFSWTILIFFLHSQSLFARESISPIPQSIQFDRKKAHLGEKLFHDKRLSRNNSISCASCHALNSFGVDGLPVSLGVQGKKGKRNSPSVYNLDFNESYFWDARANSLEAQIDGPIHDPSEMATNWGEVVRKIKKDEKYPPLFQNAFENEKIDEKNIKSAIVEFERSLLTPNAPFDRFLRGNKSAINSTQKKGYQLFKSYGCISCHQGKNIGGNMLQVFGVSKKLPKDSLGKDKGRFSVTANPTDKYVFRVPSLRNVHKTSPYFHDGSVSDLKEAIKIMGEYQLGERINDRDANYIYEFLRTLTGEPNYKKIK